MNWNTTYRGVSPDYLRVRRWPVVQGAPFSDADVAARAKVVLLGDTVRNRLFGESDPIDETIRIGSQLFRAVGVLQAKGASATQNDDAEALVMGLLGGAMSVAGVGFAVGVGLVFGYYPARHAASLDPIDA